MEVVIFVPHRLQHSRNRFLVFAFRDHPLVALSGWIERDMSNVFWAEHGDNQLDEVWSLMVDQVRSLVQFGTFVVAKMADRGDNGSMDEDHPLYWEPTYEIVLALMKTYPDFKIEDIGYQQLLDMIVALPNFVDDPAIASDELLRDIVREWYEETT